MTKIYRAVVRGHFADLDDDTRARLLAEAPAHDLFRSSFTSEGTLTYDTRLVAFNVRYEIRVPDEGSNEGGAGPEAVAVADALERTAQWLITSGIGHKHLRATVDDMAAMWH